MHGLHRRLLLELYRALAAAAPAARSAAAQACADSWELPLELELAAKPESAERVAVRVVHQLEMRAAPLCARIGPLIDTGDGAALRAALAGAPLIAGRDGRALCAIVLGGPHAAGHTGALVDAETCARIALAGGELDRGHARSLELLELAGDLVPGLPVTGSAAGEAGTVLVAAVRLGAVDAERCRTRLPATTMPDQDP